MESSRTGTIDLELGERCKAEIGTTNLEKIKLKHESSVRITSQALQESSSEESQLDQVDVYIPDGGAKAWINLAGTFVGLTGCMGIVNSNGAVEEYISHNVLPYTSQSTIGWIFSLFNFFMFGFILFVGPIFESYGSRICMAIGIGSFTMGYMGFSSSSKMYQFLLSSASSGFGLSFMFGSSVGIVGQYFRRRRALCLGIVFSGGAIGGILFPIIMRTLFPKIGFRWTIRVVGFIIIACFVIEAILTVDRNDVINPDAKSQSFYQKTLGKIKLGAFKEFTFSTLVISMMLTGFTFLLTLTYVISYAVAAGYTYHEATNLVVVMNATSIVGRSCGGYLADKFGRFNMFLAVNTTCTFCFLVLWLPHPIAHSFKGLMAFSAIYGMALGSNLPLGPSTVGQISKTSEFTSRYGTSSMCNSFIHLIGVPIGGAIIGQGKNLKGYDNMVIFIACLSIVGWGAAAASRYSLAGFAWKRV